MDGWIKLHRKITEWEWYKDANTMKLFLHLLLTATHKTLSYKNQTIAAGSVITSLSQLSYETGLSKQQIRTAINKLKSTHEITQQITHQNSIITVNKWNLYQPSNTQDNTTATHPCYNKNERREEESSSKTTNNVVSLTSSLYRPLGVYSNVYLSKEQYGTLTQLMGGEELLSVFINELSENIASKREAVFDEKYPKMHFIRLRKYFKAHQNKPKGVLNDEPKPYNPYL